MSFSKSTALLLVFLIITACKVNNKKNESLIIEKWSGKKIYFPEKIVFTTNLIDTTTFKFSQSKLKVLIYADTTDCMGCKLQLNKWKEFMTTINTVTTDTIPFLFFVFPKDMEELEYLIRSENFNYPICVDTNDQLNKLNHFSSDVTFLLDENNRVIAVGNPTLNFDIKNLYLEKVTGIKHTINSINTTAEIDQPLIDLGTFGKLDFKEFPVAIRNTGKFPLVIVDINTSCGCITASFDKQPIRPGDKTKVMLKVTPTETGFLNKTVKIRANTDKILTLNVQGNVTE